MRVGASASGIALAQTADIPVPKTNTNEVPSIILTPTMVDDPSGEPTSLSAPAIAGAMTEPSTDS